MAGSFRADGVAVITGGASGIGRAAALRAVEARMRVVLVDANAEKLAATAAGLSARLGADHVMVEHVDVAEFDAMSALADRVVGRWGAPTLLMNNAATFVSSGAGGILDPNDNWQRLFAVNVMGVVNGVQAFLPSMLEAGQPAVIVNTGSKQGLTNPSGNPAYNTSKAAVNAYTQNLARDLRDRLDCRISAHLLIPGWTTTGDAQPHPSAWMPEQVIGFMDDAISRDEFFILCPDGETPRETDEKRIYWNAMDIIANRPALSRWHKDYKQAFAEFMQRPLKL